MDEIYRFSKERGRPEYHRLQAFTFFIYGMVALISTYFPVYFRSMGLQNTQIAMLMATGPLVSLVSAPFWAYLSDRYRSVKNTLILLLIGSITIIQVVFSTASYGSVYVSLIIFFFFQNSFLTQSNSFILNTIRDTDIKFGSIRLWGSLGFSVIAVALGYVFNAKGIVWINGAFSALAICSLMLVLSIKDRDKLKQPPAFTLRGTMRLFKNKSLMLYLLLCMLYYTPNAINVTFSPIIISSMGGGSEIVGWSSFAMSILEAPVFLLLDRYLKKRTGTMLAYIAFTLFCCTIRWFLISAVTNTLQMVLVQSMHFINVSGFVLVGVQLVYHLSPPDCKATGQAMYAVAQGVSGLIAGMIGGLLYDSLGKVWLYRVMGITSLFGAVGIAVLAIAVLKGEKKTLGCKI